ncbi:MAG: hypothetical protein H7833_01255 [Magnetococcus sp. DMHC-1]|nr:hypothetical protein [Magnetococcales bacterium]
MLPSYEAIYDHGQLTWIGDTPGPVRARVIITLINEQTPSHVSDVKREIPNGTQLAAILEEMAEKGIGKIFGDPLEWQKEARRDRTLPGREEE